MEIIKPSNHRIECDKCNAVLAVTAKDIQIYDHILHVKCPCCKHTICLWYDELPYWLKRQLGD